MRYDARGIEVVHILDAKHAVGHPMTSRARIVRGKLTYVATGREWAPEPARERDGVARTLNLRRERSCEGEGFAGLTFHRQDVGASSDA